MEALTGRTNGVHLVCYVYYYVPDQPTQIKDGDSYTSQWGQPPGKQIYSYGPSLFYGVGQK